MKLDELVQVANYPAGAGSAPFYGGAGATTGTLNVDTVTPAVFSGTFAGPLAVGGPTGSLVFRRIPL